MKRFWAVGLVALTLSIAIFALARWRSRVATTADPREATASTKTDLPPLDAHGFVGVKEISRANLVELMTKTRPLARDETANLDRGCPGFVCIYQGLGLKRWPESAPGTLAYLRREDALKRECPTGQRNFVFLKQAWWVAGKPPKPDPVTGQVPLGSVTRSIPRWYTFNYAVYFPATATYAWINHREFGFPLDLIRPQKAYLSLSPPSDDDRPGQIYCSTCR